MFPLLDKILGKQAAASSGMAGSILTTASVFAWAERQREVHVEHVVVALLSMSDVRRALEARGVTILDVTGVVNQLVAEFPARGETEPDERPPHGSDVKALATAAVRRDVLPASALVEEVARRLPRELRFLEKPLAGATAELAVLDGTLAMNAEGALTFKAWDPRLRNVVGMMQSLVDGKWQGWMMWTVHFFFAIVASRTFGTVFKERGLDVAAFIREVGEELLSSGTKVRPPPPGHQGGISADLYALFLRAERYAARDHRDVELRHALEAFADERRLAPFVARLSTYA